MNMKVGMYFDIKARNIYSTANLSLISGLLYIRGLQVPARGPLADHDRELQHGPWSPHGLNRDLAHGVISSALLEIKRKAYGAVI